MKAIGVYDAANFTTISQFQYYMNRIGKFRKSKLLRCNLMAVAHTIIILMAIAENNTTNINGVPEKLRNKIY